MKLSRPVAKNAARTRASNRFDQRTTRPSCSSERPQGKHPHPYARLLVTLFEFRLTEFFARRRVVCAFRFARWSKQRADSFLEHPRVATAAMGNTVIHACPPSIQYLLGEGGSEEAAPANSESCACLRLRASHCPSFFAYPCRLNSYFMLVSQWVSRAFRFTRIYIYYSCF